jgi:hypothetical protein
MSLAGIGYAFHTNKLTGEFHISTGNMNFVFDNKEDVMVWIQGSGDKNPKDLDAKVSYKDKKLLITDIGPVDLEDFTDGDAVITIKYAIKAKEKKKGMRLPAEIEGRRDSGYDLGIIELELLSHTPVWRLENDGGSWGTKSSGIKGTPDIIYDFLPDDLGDFHVYNQLKPHNEKEVMVGTLTLQQESVPDLPDFTEIGLSSLDLPDKVIKEIKDGSEDSLLEIKGSYGFAVPLNLDQFNLER